MAEQTYGDWIRSNPPLPTKKYKKEHMSQMTALEQLIDWIDSDCTPMDCVMKAKELLNVEKHQHGNTWDAAIKAHDDRGHVHARSIVDFDEWYEETFKK